MEFTPEDFNRLMFNVHAHGTTGDLTAAFPELRLYDAFSKSLTVDGLKTPMDKNKIIRYIVYVYDKNSPYRIKYKDITQRKVRAILDAGFEMNGNKFDEHIEDVLMGKNLKICDMIIAFLKLHCDVNYQHLVMLETMYDKKMKEVLLGSTSEKVKELNDIKNSYEQTQTELLMQDKDKGLIKSLYKSINSDKLEMAPEDIANKIKKDGIPNTVRDLEGN